MAVCCRFARTSENTQKAMASQLDFRKGVRETTRGFAKAHRASLPKKGAGSKRKVRLPDLDHTAREEAMLKQSQTATLIQTITDEIEHQNELLHRAEAFSIINGKELTRLNTLVQGVERDLKVGVDKTRWTSTI